VDMDSGQSSSEDLEKGLL